MNIWKGSISINSALPECFGLGHAGALHPASTKELHGSSCILQMKQTAFQKSQSSLPLSRSCSESHPQF